MKFKFIEDLTSDVMFEAYGKNLKELFENSAEALFTIICEIEKIEPKKEKIIEVSGEDIKDLLFNWLQSLIAVVDVDEMFLSKFKIEEINETKVRAKCYGEDISKEKSGTVVKGVTYYNFDIEKNENGYVAKVVLDI